MNTADDLLRRALECIDWHCPQVTTLRENIRAYLDAPEMKDEPVYLARRKGLDDFFTCSKDRYEELSVLDLFETKLAYLHQPTKTAPKDELLNLNCKSVQKRLATQWGFLQPKDPMTNEEMAAGFTEPRHSQWQAFVAGCRWSEKHHLEIGERDD